ncbi:Uncharacterised protein [Halioglobus japonicus]|nr:Uncharacterised protein [Halioglobus japonicus]
MFGCQKNYVVKEYVPPTSSQGASVQVTTDPYRNYDQIDIGLVSRDSCDNKYNLEHISHLESGPLWGEDIREADFYLPAGKTINLRIMNSTDYGFYKKHCSNTKTYILKESSNYVLKIKNWSSLEEPELFESSFGCKFDLTRSDGSVLDEAVTDLPKCED